MAHVEQIVPGGTAPEGSFRALESNLMPLLLSFLFPGNPFALILLYAFSQIHNEDDSIPPGDPLGALRQKRHKAKLARHEYEKEKEHAATAQRASQTPEPWPQALPTNLPPFPSGWVRADPPTRSMVLRAYQLLQPLWLQGQGARSTERDAASHSWVTYVAEPTHEGKQAIVAYVIDKHGHHQPAQSTADHAGRPVLRRGSGMAALGSQKPYVLDVQTRLHVVPADGMFGADTMNAVIAFQKKHGTTADGVVGPATWALLDQLPDPRTQQAYNVQVGPAYNIHNA